jgi:hypothetical protein
MLTWHFCVQQHCQAKWKQDQQRHTPDYELDCNLHGIPEFIKLHTTWSEQIDIILKCDEFRGFRAQVIVVEKADVDAIKERVPHEDDKKDQVR